MYVTHFIRFIRDREQMRINKKRGIKPITRDSILRDWHFCNIDREDDYVTKWIRKNVTATNLNTLCKELIVCRIFNEPAVLKTLLQFTPLDPVFRGVLESRQKAGMKIFRAAYMMTTHGSTTPQPEFYTKVLQDIYRNLNVGQPDTLQEVANHLLTHRGIGPFLANQVCADLRYHTYRGKFGTRWKDWQSFIILGNGTKRGMKWLGLKPKPASLLKLRQDLYFEWPDELHHIKRVFQDPNNLANALCEFDKYCRAEHQLVNGETVRLKRKYKPNPQS